MPFLWRMGGGHEHFDDFTGDEGGVAVEADEAFGATNQASAFDGDINLKFPSELYELIEIRRASCRERV